VPDRKPTKLVVGERATLLTMLQYQRESFVRKVSGVDDEAARRSLVPSGTTLRWLTRHLARAEAIWVLGRFVGTDTGVPDDDVDASDTTASAIAAYRATWTVIDPIIGEADLDATCARMDPGDAQVNLRWILVHLVQETARHAGHADILRELVDGQTGR
jgi:hypothetical protein